MGCASSTPTTDMGPFPDSVLWKRPAVLPYADDYKWVISRQLKALHSAYPSLKGKMAAFTNDGRTVNLLQAEGKIPISFQGKRYNIPIIIWLVENYPRRSPPLVYVNPTKDWVLKKRHPCVDPSGLVSIPYLQEWEYTICNLVGLVENLIAAFGKEPPLFKSRRRPNPNHQAGEEAEDAIQVLGLSREYQD